MSSSLLPANALEFLGLFPSGSRICRIINRRSGTLLDIEGSTELQNDSVPRVVGNRESAGVQYWIIAPHGSGQAIIPIPKDRSQKVQYLTPSTMNQEIAVTVSPFPCSWNILPSSDCPGDKPLVPFSSLPEGIYEEWTCLIGWPQLRGNEARMLDLWAGEAQPNQRVVIYPFEYKKQWQYWQIQFIRNVKDKSDPILPILIGTPQAPGAVTYTTAGGKLQ